MCATDDETTTGSRNSPSSKCRQGERAPHPTHLVLNAGLRWCCDAVDQPIVEYLGQADDRRVTGQQRADRRVLTQAPAETGRHLFDDNGVTVAGDLEIK